MKKRLYDPFKNPDIQGTRCFLTGQTPPESIEAITVFPSWILDRYQLQKSYFRLLEGGMIRYEDLKVPCSHQVREQFLVPLETTIRDAFAAGFASVSQLDPKILFQWMGKILYALSYLDFLKAARRQHERDKPFSLSPDLHQKLGTLHTMLQSIILPMNFTKPEPWSIFIYKVHYSKDLFHFRDDPTKLFFSLAMNGFGLIAFLQDHGAVANYQSDLLKKVSSKTLHPVQFEELTARLLYTRYLLKEKPKHLLEEVGDEFRWTTIPINSDDSQAFAAWDDTLYGQLLTDYLSPWGLTKDQLIRFPNDPISYLENERSQEFIAPEAIPLPY